MLRDVIKRFLHKGNSYKQRFREEQEYRKVQDTLNARSKNANERELERFIEENRQKKINIALKQYRKKRQEENWKTTPINRGWKTMTKNDGLLKPNTLGKKATMLKGDFRNKVK